jgi:predicted MPP superfamily phosphohydrolase
MKQLCTRYLYTDLLIYFMMNRRKFMRYCLALGAGGLGLGLYSWQVEPYWVDWVKLPMPVRHLPAELAGKTLMQISDIHIGKRFNYDYIIKTFKEAQALQPDFVVFTGDYVSTYKDKVLFHSLEEVMQHAPKGRLGTVGIMGNHDYGKKFAEKEVGNEVAALLQQLGIHMLRNEQQAYAGLNFIGFDDYWGPHFDPRKVMNAYNPEQAGIVLCHNPDVCDLDVWNGYKGWILAGHTHGGQAKPPFLDPLILPVKNKRYTSGKIELEKERTLYINRALGHLWPLRFNVRPEVTLFALEPAIV